MRTKLLTGIATLLLGSLLAAAAEPRGRDLEKTVIALAASATPKTALVYGAIGLGSGAVVDASGTTVTNAHVGLLARVAILEFADGRKVKARRRGMDLERDLAIYEPISKLAKPVPFFELETARPKAGTWLVALGYPGGPRGDLRPTVSLGQATEGGGLPSPVAGILRYDDAVRTDIAIFSGNSGGPLIDLAGKLVGLNGAMEIGSGAAFAVPADLVAERLESLKGGAIRLPGGRVLSGKSALSKMIDRAIEPTIEKLVDRVHDSFNSRAAVKLPKLAHPSDGLARRLRETAREKALVAEFHAAKDLCVLLDGQHMATRIDRKHLVAKASFLGDQKDWKAGSKTAHVVARDDKNDLALLVLDEEADVKVPADSEPKPGALCAAIGPDGVLAAGIVSVGPREIPEAVSARIATGGIAAPIISLLRRLEEAAPSLKGQLEQVISQLEAQEALNVGNEPRGYGNVLSHDAPLAPSEAGAPLVDLDGKLVGVNVSNANYGTSYAVPIATVRGLFKLAAKPAKRVEHAFY